MVLGAGTKTDGTEIAFFSSCFGTHQNQIFEPYFKIIMF